jgi:protocatechuate 3,4-dioxygenase beta subunit
MLDDDRPIGRVLTRREALRALGLAGLGWATGSACSGATGPENEIPDGTCVVRPALTIGPYFVDERLNRSDIRSDPSDGSVRPGSPLSLRFNVSQLAGAACSALAAAVVDVWHCDHLGVYSDVSDPGFNTVGKKFLRGYQETDASGVAHFTTIYPGWYQGRTVHIHYRIRSAPSVSPGFDFVSQLFFDDAFTDQVYGQAPYNARGARSTRNVNDGIYLQGSSGPILNVVSDGSGGYSTTFSVAIQR